MQGIKIEEEEEEEERGRGGEKVKAVMRQIRMNPNKTPNVFQESIFPSLEKGSKTRISTFFLSLSLEFTGWTHTYFLSFLIGAFDTYMAHVCSLETARDSIFFMYLFFNTSCPLFFKTIYISSYM